MKKAIKGSYLPVLAVLVMSILLGGCGNEQKQQEPIISLYHADLQTTEEIALEEYLYGVVAAEMATDWPQEALAAQAVLARTFTLEKIEDGGVQAHGTDASTDIEEFQAYDAQIINDAVRQAVEETRGMVIEYNGELIKAWFFADGGGITASSAAEGLAYEEEETPYIHSVEDPGAQFEENENNAWQAEFSIEQVKQALAEITGSDQGDITRAAIAQYGPSGRATMLDFNGQSVGAPTFRLAIGSQEMKSTLLRRFEIADGKLIIEGSGYGHGVGMSQWGARAMAEQGANWQEIIEYFFQDINIVQQYE